MRLDPDTPTCWYRTVRNVYPAGTRSRPRPFVSWNDPEGGDDLVASTRLFLLLIPCASSGLQETP